MSGDDLVRKAQAAARAARLLNDAGDFDGCANRAYYAMFDMARAFLVARHGLATDAIKTHSGLISAFSRLGVKQDGLPVDLGRWLNQAAEARASADYDTRSVNHATATVLLSNMDRFIASLSTEMGADKGGNP